MGRMKDIAISMMEAHEQVQGDLFIDDELRTLMQNSRPWMSKRELEELQVLMENFKPSPDELQAELEELQAHATSLPAICVQPEIKVYLMMKNGFPQRSYTDRALAFYECWVCTEGDMHAETPDDYYVVEIMHDQSSFKE